MNLDTMRLLVAKGFSAADLLEVAETLARTEGRSAAAERQARYRARLKDGDVTDDVTRYVTDVTTPPLSRPLSPQTPLTPTHTPPDGNTRARKGTDFPKPEWADAEVWADFLKNRKTKRLPNTATAYRGLLDDIGKIASDEWPPGRLLEHAARKGWGAIYEPDELKGIKNGNANRTSGNTGTDRRSSLARAIDESREWLDSAQAGLS